MIVKKRDDRLTEFNSDKIYDAILKAESSYSSSMTDNRVAQLSFYADEVSSRCESKSSESAVSVEDIQDLVESVLVEYNELELAKRFILYRNSRNKSREMNTTLMKVMKDLNLKEAKDHDLKRENANIDGDTAMGNMLRCGSETYKQFYHMFMLKPEHSKAHIEGDIHIHDLDFYGLTETCCQIDVSKLLRDGFCTGHGFLREPNSIMTASALACIAIQSNQNDQHGGQSIPNFDYGLAPYVKKSFIRNIITYLGMHDEVQDSEIIRVKELLEEYSSTHNSIINETGKIDCSRIINEVIDTKYINGDSCVHKATEYTEKETYQAMEALIHNLNTMHCFHPDQEVKALAISSSRDIAKMSKIEKNALEKLLKDLYETQKLTMTEICSELRVSRKILYKLFSAFGVKVRSSKENYKSRSNYYAKCHEVDNPMKLDENKAKVVATQKANHNGLLAFNTDKQKATNIERYGSPNPMNNPKIVAKMMESNKSNHDGVHNFQSESHRKFMNDKYGCDNYPSLKFMRDEDGIIRTKIEKKLYELLSDDFPDLEIIRSKRSLIPSNGKLEVDIYFPQLKFGIEVNGSYSHNKDDYLNDVLNDTQSTKESMKKHLLRKEGIELMHVWEDDYKANPHLVYADILYHIFRIYIIGGEDHE